MNRTTRSPVSRAHAARGFRHTVTLALLSIWAVGCGGGGGGDSSGQLDTQIAADQDIAGAGGPPIFYVNTTGFSSSMKIGWEAVPGANMYALTKTVGRNVTVFWVEGTEFVDTEVPASGLTTYSLMSNTLSGGLGPPGAKVRPLNNRPIVANMNAMLRSAGSRAEVQRIVKDQMEQHFDRIFIGQDSEGLTFNDRAMLFSFFVAHNYVPYGHSSKFDVMELLQEQSLDCDNYSVLAGLLFHLITDGTRLDSLEFIGFDQGPIGNHAQLLYTPDAGGEVWLVDPTVGIVATFDDAEQLLAGGKAHRLSDYYAYFDSDLQPTDIPPWIVRIKNALTQGGYRQEHVIYWYATLAPYMKTW